MTREYTILKNVQEELRLTTSFGSNTVPKSTTVTRWIQEESADIELRSNAIFGSNLESSVYFDYDGSGVFRFPDADIISITGFEFNVNARGLVPSWITLEEGFDKNFIVYDDEAEVHFVGGENATYKVMPTSGQQKFRVTYSRGQESTPLSVQKLCTLLVAKRTIQSLSNSQSNSEGGTIQVGTIRVTEPGNYSISYLKSLDAEIDKLWDYIGKNINTFRYVRVYD